MKFSLLDTFRDFSEYRAWLDKAYQNLSPLNADQKESFSPEMFNFRGERTRDWYGQDVTYEELSAGITEYSSPELLGELLSKVKSTISTEALQKITVKRLRFNDLGLGVFSFDRAAMGLYRIKEYYSPSLERRVMEDEITKSDGRIMLTADGSPVEERWEQRPDGSPRGRTTTKRLFAYFPKDKQTKRAVSIVVSAGGHAGIKAKDFLYSGLSAVVIAQLLEQAGICTSIYVLIGTFSYPEGKKEFNGCLVPAKGPDEALDANLVAMTTSDPRFFRFEGFKGLLAAYDHFGRQAPDGLGILPNAREMVEILSKHKKGGRKASPIDNLVCISGCFSENAAREAIEDAIDEITSMPGNQP